MTPFNQGYQSQSEGQNPYKEGSVEFNHWNDGFAAGKRYREEVATVDVANQAKIQTLVQPEVVVNEPAQETSVARSIFSPRI